MDARAVVLDAVAKVTKRQGLGEDVRLAEDLGIRSLQRIELAALIEDGLGKELGNTAVMKAKTIHDLVVLASA